VIAQRTVFEERQSDTLRRGRLRTDLEVARSARPPPVERESLRRSGWHAPPTPCDGKSAQRLMGSSITRGRERTMASRLFGVAAPKKSVARESCGSSHFVVGVDVKFKSLLRGQAPGSKVFISYRHTDSSQHAPVIRAGLDEMLGTGKVFLDEGGIPTGEDWYASISDAVRGADWCLCLVGTDWMGNGSDGHRRIDDRNDVVRFEVATAITAGVSILPVRINRADIPRIESLPRDIALLARTQAGTWSAETSAGDLRRIAERIRQRSMPKAPIPPELVGSWSTATNLSASSYEFDSNRTFGYLGRMTQTRPEGPYSFEVHTEGMIEVRGEFLDLKPFRTSASQQAPEVDANNYFNSPRELINQSLRWRCEKAGNVLLLQYPDGAVTRYERDI
jgi:hypothetical protein